MKRVLICSAILLCLISLAYGGGRKCAVCGKLTPSGYVVYSYNYIVCTDCNKTASRCEQCGRPAAKLFLSNRNHICADCKSGVVRCEACGKKLVNSFIQLYSPYMKVCLDCARLKRCTQCGAPSVRLTPVGNAKLCNKCLGDCNNCSDCGKTLLREDYKVDERPGAHLCKSCYYKYMPCSICGQPARSGYHKNKYDQPICKGCWSATQPTISTAREVSRKIANYLSSSLQIRLRRPVAFVVHKRSELIDFKQNYWEEYRANTYNEKQNVNISVLLGAQGKDLYWGISQSYGDAWI
jgi:hypothetical protein